MEKGPESVTEASGEDVEVTVVVNKVVAKDSVTESKAAVRNFETQNNDETVTVPTIVVQSNIQPVSSDDEVVEEEEIEESVVEEIEESVSESEKEVAEKKEKTIQPASTAEGSAEYVKPVKKNAVENEAVIQKLDETKATETKSVETISTVQQDSEQKPDEEEDESEEEEVKEVDAKEVITVKQEAEPVTRIQTVEKPNESEQQVDQSQQRKHETVNNTIKEIISDIDSNILEQERIAQLKQEELKLLQKQQELAHQIQEQQLLAQRLASQNNLMQQKYQQQQLLEQQQQKTHSQNQFNQQEANATIFRTPPQTTVSKVTTYEETKDGTITKKSETYETEESSNVTKRIDLQKIFTPATDSDEIQPKNRKLYASSAFYSPTLHPTVEDQVELARRISHSLSDISNQQSKGQSMYVNRKKRSVKWVHEGQAGEQTYEEFYEQQQKENTELGMPKEQESKKPPLEKVPLRLLMNPRGEVRDYNSMRDSLNIETGLLSPEKCAELVTDLQTQKGRGAELFAKRRKKADKWVVDETNANTHSSSGLPDYHPYQAPQPKPPTSPSILPAYSDAGKHRVQLNLHQEQLLEKYTKPGLKVVRSPWEAALETGSASTAFMEDSKRQHQHSITPIPSPALQTASNSAYTTNNFIEQQVPELQQYNSYKPASYNDHQKDLAYKPSVPQGWKAPSVSLPKDAELIYLEDVLQKDHPSAGECPCDESDLEIISYNLRKLKESLNTDFENEIIEKIDMPKTHAEIFRESENDYQRVVVRKQLEELERQQREIASFQHNELNLEKRRSRNQYVWKYQEKKKNSENLKTTQELASEVSEEQEKKEEYIKVAVRDLIQNFENQTNLEVISTLNLSTSPGSTHLKSKELYMPKDIPLESYAPPPVMNIKPSTTYSPYPHSQVQKQNTWIPAASPAISAPIYDNNTKSAVDERQTGIFPLSNKNYLPTEYGEGNNFPTSANVPPKQQYWDPSSYQKVPPLTGTQKPPQVNFNPSPLSYEKLAKFENSEAEDPYRQYSPQQQYQHQPQRYLTPKYSNKVRNVSPIPFGSRSTPQQQFNDQCSVSPHSLPFQVNSPHPTNYSNNVYTPSLASPSASQFNSSELLHAPTFNNSARGWKGAGGRSSGLYSKPLAPLTTVGNMPYTDF